MIDSPLGFAELATRAERVDAGGLVLRIAGVEDLITMKEAAARDQDLAAVVADPTRKRGVVHAYTLEQLRAFRDVPAEQKLRWLEGMRRFLARTLTPEKIEVMQRFRRGEL